jgi:molybdenum cofactor cytidylyltransferase
MSADTRLALVGAGGKTTAIFLLARSWQDANPTDKPTILLTTTTHLMPNQVDLADHHYYVTHPNTLPSPGQPLPGGVLLYTGLPTIDEQHENRVSGLDNASLSRLLNLANHASLPLLIEADGARSLPLKAPADHEPAIPPFVNLVAVVVGLSALDKVLTANTVHRPNRFAELCGITIGQSITKNVLLTYLRHPEGALKNIPPLARRVLLLNQADTFSLQAQAKWLAHRLLPLYDTIIITSLAPQTRIGNEGYCSTTCTSAINEPVAGIILAAGGASRFGQPKMLLPWHGEPLIRHIARIASQSGLSPLIIVAGDAYEQIAQAVQGIQVVLVHNLNWQAGQSSSLQVGLNALQVYVGAAIFIMADQPQISPTFLRKLIELHAQTLAPIIAPQVDGQRTTPVLFDRETFTALHTIRGDIGGRAIFSQFPVMYLPWCDHSLLGDIDTPQDYQRYLDDNLA